MAQNSNTNSDKIIGSEVISGTSKFETRYNPWVITCSRWHDLGFYIVLPINPADLSWHIPLNMATEQTRHTTVSYIWRNNYINISSDGSNLSEESLLQDFNITLTFNSADIAPRVTASTAKDWRNGSDPSASNNYVIDPDGKASDLIAFNRYGAMDNPVAAMQANHWDSLGYATDYDLTAPLGIQNFYRFLSLLDEPKTYVARTDSPKTYKNAIPTRTNRITLVANTPAFPTLLLYGSIEPSGVTWEESVEHPNSFDVTFTMIVTEVAPRMGVRKFSDMLTAYKTAANTTWDTRNQLETAYYNGLTKEASLTVTNDTTGKTTTTDLSTPSSTAGNGSTSSAVAQTEADQATADAASADGTEDKTPETTEPDLTKYDTSGMTAAELADLKNAVATGATPATEAAQTAIAEENIAIAKTATADALGADLLTTDNAYTKAQQAKNNSYTTAQLMQIAAYATVSGTALQNQVALALAQNPNLTNTQKISAISNIRNTIKASTATQMASARIPGATRKGSKSS